MATRAASGNPFPYQRPIQPDQIIDRDNETAQLRAWCQDGMLVRLDAPRRYGKTSLVTKLIAEAEKDGTVGVLVDMKGVLTISDIVTRLGIAYTSFQGPIASFLKPLLSGIQAQFNVSFAGTGAGVKITGREQNLEGALLSLLAIPEKFASNGWQGAIVCFDEFQDVLRVEAADDKIRSVIQHHTHVAYIFAGSEPRMMNELFGEKNRAFWAQAEPLELEPLDLTHVSQYVTHRFADSGKEVGEALTPLLQATQGHPQRTMFIASKLWAATPVGESASLATWEAALAKAKLQEEHALESEWRGLTGPEQRVLRAVITSGGHPHRKAARDAVDLPKGSVSKASALLVDKYVLRQIAPGRFGFMDPLLELYVRDLADASLPTVEDAEESDAS